VGCIRKLGCLVLLVLLAAALWLTRGRWLPLVRGGGGAATATSTEGVWEPLTTAGAERARKAIDGLASRSGPVFANLRPGDVASYVFIALRRELPPSAENVAATVIGDRMYVRADVKLTDVGGAAVLGPLASFLGDRETMMFGGTFEVLRPGLAQFHVQELKLRELSIPQRMIPRLVQKIGRGSRPPGVAPDALPLLVPEQIGDVRVSRGRVTLYKNVP
jgi:hypothetical protein